MLSLSSASNSIDWVFQISVTSWLCFVKGGTITADDSDVHPRGCIGQVAPGQVSWAGSEPSPPFSLHTTKEFIQSSAGKRTVTGPLSVCEWLQKPLWWMPNLTYSLLITTAWWTQGWLHNIKAIWWWVDLTDAVSMWCLLYPSKSDSLNSVLQYSQRILLME